MTTSPTTAHVSVHRWPWRTQEHVSIALSVILGVGIGYLTHSLIWLPVCVAVGVFGGWWLYHVKVKRCTLSQVNVHLDGTVVKTESRGALGKSRADLAALSEITYRRFGSDECLQFAANGSSVRIPLRATIDPKIAAVVADAFALAEAQALPTSADAKALYDRLLRGDFPDGINATQFEDVQRKHSPSI